MGVASGDKPSDRDAFVDPDDSGLEPEVVRWLEMYTRASDGVLDRTVAGILDEMNRLLGRYRKESAVYRADFRSRLRTLTEHMPVMLWTTDTKLRVTTFSGGGLAAVDINPSSSVSLALAVVLGTDTSGLAAVEAHKQALHGQSAVFEYDRRSRSYLAHVQPLPNADGVIVGTIGLAIDATESKNTEAELARRERQLGDTQRVAQVGSFEFDLATNRLYWSDEHFRILGLKPEPGPVTSESVSEFIHPDDVERAWAVWETSLRTGEPYVCDLRVRRPDGEIRVIHSRGALVRDADGEPERMVGTIQDVTELRHAVEVAHATRHMLERALQCFPNGAITVLDSDRRYVMASGRGFAQAGLTPEHVIGKALAEVYPPDVLAAMEGPLRRAFAGETVTVDVPCGERIYTLSLAPLDVVDGAVHTIITVSQDITERVRAERALARREAQLAEAQRLAQSGSWEYDFATNRLSWSEEEHRIFGWRPELGPPSREMVLAHIHPDDRERSRAVWDTAIRTGEPYAWDFRIVRPDGEIRVIHSRGALIRDAAGQPERMVGSSQDITERVQAERALARREAQLAEAQRLAQLGSWERDIATGQLTWSDELYRIYGLEPQEIPASFEAFMKHVHPDDAARVRAINEAAVRSGRSFEYQARILRPDGEVRHYHSRGVVLRDASGRPSRLVGVVQDATERTRAEEERVVQRERQARLEGMLYVVRDLASRVTRSLATAPEDGAVPGPGPSVLFSLDEAHHAAAALTKALDDISALQRQTRSE
jgi:PAS domain S-box-containing protein